jgi:ceramide glucosyltransferase
LAVEGRLPMYLSHPLTTIIAFATLSVAAGYAVLTVIAVLIWRLPGKRPLPQLRPPVTVLKPLRGAEPGLYDHLKSFCIQDYPDFEIIFGVSDPTDPACTVVDRLAQEFPQVHMVTVVDARVHGSNGKISNLMNMLPRARHDVFVMSDSDSSVGPDYLAAVTAPLQDPAVGVVTCLYRGIPTRHVWSRLGAMYINEWYLPTVIFAWLFGHEGYVSGQTCCIRRDTLEAVGGFGSLVNHLADDHRLGTLVRERGLKIVLSRYMVKAEHHEQNLTAVTRHELRWMRTLRALRPMSLRCIFLTFSLPLAVVGIILARAEAALSVAAWVLFFTAVSARLMLHFVHRWDGERALLADIWLLPVRDAMLCWVWCRSLFTSRVSWRGHEFTVNPDGTMNRLS